MLLRAFAKINLDLKILGKRPDGYHEVRTTLQTIDWADEIHLSPAGGFEFVTEGVPEGEDNLVVRAVRAFERITGLQAKARVELVKRVPVGAGLGGGSADAAVALMGLGRFFEVPIPDEELMGALRSLGSDVPFFAKGGCGLGTGRGDEVSFLADGPAAWLVIVNPGVAISTAEAYSWLTVPDKTHSIEGFYAGSIPGPAEETPANDFEKVVFDRYPQLAGIKGELLECGASRAALSGSGSSIFGIFGSEEAAWKALPVVERYGVSRVTRLLPREEYQRRIWGVAKW